MSPHSTHKAEEGRVRPADWLEDLNPEQRAAVLHPGGHLLVVAGALIVLTMFAGRVGMAALAITPPRRIPRETVDVPEEEVLVG